MENFIIIATDKLLLVTVTNVNKTNVFCLFLSSLPLPLIKFIFLLFSKIVIRY